MSILLIVKENNVTQDTFLWVVIWGVSEEMENKKQRNISIV